MSLRVAPPDSQGMTFGRPFAWLIAFGMTCSLVGLYRIVELTPPANAAAPAPRTSAAAAPTSADVNVPQTSVTQAPLADTAAATPATVAGSLATPTPTQGAAAERPVLTLPAVLASATGQPVPSEAKASQLFDLMNNARARAGVQPLARDPALDDVALTRARNLVDNGYFDHYSPDGESAFSELAVRGIRYRLAGENLARNNFADNRTVDAAFEALMASTGHRANILEERFGRAGVAAVQSGKMWVYVTVFKD